MFFRTQHPISPTFVSGVKNPNIVTEFKEVEDTIKSGHTFQESFTKIVKNESNCSSTMFFKAKYVSNQYKITFKSSYLDISVQFHRCVRKYLMF